MDQQGFDERENSRMGTHLLDDGKQAAVVDSNASAEQVPHVRDLREKLIGSCRSESQLYSFDEC